MKMTIGCICLILVSLMFVGISNAKIDPAIITGLWHFDEGQGVVAEDSSGNKNTGKITGAKWVDGKVGKALLFSGGDNIVDCGTNAILDSKNVTMAMWVWFDKIPYTSNIALSKEGKYRLIAGDFDTSHVSIRYATAKTAWGPGTAAGKTVLTAKTWHHVAATYDGAKWKLYLNGRLDGEKPESGILLASSSPLFLGNFALGGAWAFTGMLDEVMIASEAIAEGDIGSLMSLAPVLPAGKVATYWGEIKR
jgi:hypothetical protein